MKKVLRKLGAAIMTLTTMITVNACSLLDNSTADKVCNALSDKYGESFIALKIGDRFNTNGTKLYIYPADNKNILFTARLNENTGVVEDDYVEEKVNYQVEKILKESLLKEGISSSSRCMVVTKDSLDTDIKEYTPESFSKAYGIDHYTIYLALKKGNYSAPEILIAIKTANEKIGVKLVVVGYIFDDKNYSECVSEIESYADIGITMIEANSPLSSFDVIVEQGICSVSESELSEQLGTM